MVIIPRRNAKTTIPVACYPPIKGNVSLSQFSCQLRRNKPWRPKIGVSLNHHVFFVDFLAHRIHGAGIYTNIGGILMVNVTIYSSTMDPMGGGSSMYGTPHILPIFFRALPAQDWPGPKLWCEGPETISLRDNFNKDERTGEGPLSS